MGNEIKEVFMQKLELSISDIEQWYQNNTPVLIDAPPGSGKTYSVSSVFDKFAQMYDLKILAIAPRRTTVMNMSKEYKNCKCITEKTIQTLQKQRCLGEYLNQFQILVIDEVHSMVTDVFIKENHPFMELVLDEFQGLVIGMTGTNFYNLETLFADAYGKNWVKIDVAKSFEFLYDNTIFFYKSDETARFLIRQALENKEKVFVGCDHIETLQNMGACCKDECFSIISKGSKHRDVLGVIDDAIMQEFIESGEYPVDKCILLCTRANELGTSIFSDVRIIVISADDLTSVVQFARRVRTNGGTKVKIYVRAYNHEELQQKYEDAVQHIRMCKMFERNSTEFLERYHRYIDDDGGILYTAYNKNTEQYEVRVNPLRRAYWKKRVEVFGVQEMRYWIHQVCSVFGDCSFQVISKPELHMFMENHEEQFLTKEEQQELKRISGARTMNKINEVCSKEKIPRRVVSERDDIKVNGKRSQPRRWAIRREA